MAEHPISPGTAVLLGKLAALRTELVEQAFHLERQGRLDAADVAIATSVRLGELDEEHAGAAGRSPANPAEAVPRHQSLSE